MTTITALSGIIREIHQACRVEGTLPFPEAIRRLADAGVESYHTDYRRAETTYYLVDGSSYVVPDHHPDQDIAPSFDLAALTQAIRFAQSGDPAYTYAGFVEHSRLAGCIGYLVFLTGQQALYLGHRGDLYVERFPGSR